MSKKLTIEYIREQFEKEKYKLLTEKYINNEQKLDYICPKGHRHFVRWSNWVNGRRCPCQSNLMKPTIEFIRSEFAKENYILLSKEYRNSKLKLDYICPKGHKHFVRWGDWQQGQRCPFHSKYRNRYTIEFIRPEFEKEDYILLTEKYTNAHQKLEYICPKGHRHSISWHNWCFGKRCPYCVIIASKGEIEVRNFIKSLGVKVLSNNRNQIFNPNTGNGLELDIFMPTLSKAIEYNGEYWHKKRKNKDSLKQQLCESKGIGLLTIWENKWKTKNDVCRDEIKKFIFVDFDA